MTTRLRCAPASHGFWALLALASFVPDPPPAAAQAPAPATSTTNAALLAAKASVTQAQSDQSQAKMDLLQGQLDLIKAQADSDKAKCAEVAADAKLAQAKLDAPIQASLLVFLKSAEPQQPPDPKAVDYAAKFKDWCEKDSQWKAAMAAAQKASDAAAKSVSDAQAALINAQADVKTKETAANVAQGVYNRIQTEQQKADAKAQQAIQSLLNQVQTNSTATPTTTKVALTTPNLLLLANALTPMTIGRWGTPIGLDDPGAPIPSPCVETPCPLIIPYARPLGPCGSLSTVSTLAGRSLPASVFDAGTPMIAPAQWSARPVGGTIYGDDASAGHHRQILKAVPAPGCVPARESNPMPLSRPMALRRRATTPGSIVKRVSYQVEEEPAAAGSQPAADGNVPPEMPPMMGAVPGPVKPLPIPLPNTPETQRQLRYFGAVAPPPAPPKPPQAEMDEADDGDQIPKDPFSFQPRITVVQALQSPNDPQALRPDPSDRKNFLINSLLTELGGDRVLTYYFDLPARFPMAKYGPPRVGTTCCAFEGEGAVIHEGMRMLARQDGLYEVRFNITTPAIPVVVRLQIVLYEKDAHLPRTLTLPPIVLQPTGTDAFPRNLLGGTDPTSYIVSVRGYSQVIKEVQGDQKDRFLLVKRIGSARFGSGVRYQSTP
jgi:hypothetical protein